MSESLGLETSGDNGPVECLGMTFSTDQERWKHFRKLLAEKLRDPEFRKQEGFPLGSDEAILRMSDPPYYTACPNPWLVDFVKHYGKPYDPAIEYSREPLAIDVSEGKMDPLYKAHSYHTKVPHLAIMPSILHYTEPGDLVLDGFAGSGMTGVAAQMCGDASASYQFQLDVEWRQEGKKAPQWGARRAVLSDLSPAATFIAANYNLPVDVDEFAKAGRNLLNDVEEEIRWMYETLHTDGKTVARIEYTVWSEIFTCPDCAGEISFLDEALDEETKRVRDVFPCPHCGVELNKNRLDRVLETRIDPITAKPWSRIKLKPSLIIYKIGKTRFEKHPDDHDYAVLSKIESMSLPPELPTVRFPIEKMYHGSRLAPKGFTNVHHFFLPRAAQSLGLMWCKAMKHPDVRVRQMLLFFVEQALWTMSVCNSYRPSGFSQVSQYMKGIYYVPSQHSEASPWYVLSGKLKRLAATFQSFRKSKNGACICTGTAAVTCLPEQTIDYIFTDPPFGENIFYADLNFLVESWHGVSTDAKPEAIIDKFKNKALPEYQNLMQRCFREYYRVLKPGRWMTVVFSNSKAAVWNAIQVALQEAGFVVAEVSALDKVQGSYRQVTSMTAVKQDLVISAYKPDGGLEQRFGERGATPDSAWDFVKAHLKQLSVTKSKDELMEFVVERDPRRIYDRLIAWFVRHDAPVPVSSYEFQEGLRQRSLDFPERDGMIFLPEQVGEYDRKRAQATQAPQLEMFISDERSAIDWLTDFLKKRPSTYPEVHPEFFSQLGAGWKKHEQKPELLALLEDNFLRYSDTGEVPSQIHSYLSTNFKDLRGLDKNNPQLLAKAKDRWYVPDPNKAQDLEKKREKALLREFDTYLVAPGRRLKEFRLEVLRTGFRVAWGKKEYETIIKIAQKIPDEVLQEDEKLLLWYDQAVTRAEASN